MDERVEWLVMMVGPLGVTQGGWSAVSVVYEGVVVAMVMVEVMEVVTMAVAVVRYFCCRRYCCCCC